MDDASSQDQDQRLAERIGQVRAESGSLEELRALDDDLMSSLLAYRQALDAEAAATSPETANRLWSQIEAEMEASEEAVTRRASSRPARANATGETGRERRRAPTRLGLWRAAIGFAVLLVVGVVAWWVWPAPDAALVAEASTAVTTYETPAGDVVRLRPHSRLYRASDEESRFRLEGEALFDVTPRSDAPFAVEADGAVVRVLGTRFTVQTWTPRPTVFLEEGRVELQNVATGDTASLRPGESATIDDDGAVAVQSATADTYVDWLDGQLTFESQPAATVAAELEQHYGVQLRLPDSVAAQTLTGRLLLDDQARALEDFGRVLGGRFDRANGSFRFRRD